MPLESDESTEATTRRQAMTWAEGDAPDVASPGKYTPSARARSGRRVVFAGGVLLVALLAALALPLLQDDQREATAARDSVAALPDAAAAAECSLQTYMPDGGGDHTEGRVRYSTNPPTSGKHHPAASQDGVYEPGDPPLLTQSVHALEHGRINIQYRAGLPASTVAELEELYEEPGAYHTLLFENQTKMPYALAATAWGQLLGCEQVTPAALDAVRAFQATYVDKGPEFVP